MYYLGHEREAHTLRLWHTSLFPGPFQTAAYARELIRVEQPTATTERVDELVEARLARQHMFNGPDAPNALVVLNEAVLHHLLRASSAGREPLLPSYLLSGPEYQCRYDKRSFIF
jgi:hypothetical protein